MLAVTEIISRVRSLTHDENENGYTDNDILICINGGIRFIRRLIKQYKPLILANPPIAGTIAAGVNSIKLSQIITKVIDIRIDGEVIFVTNPLDIYDLKKTGKPHVYYMTGFDTVHVYPIPLSDVQYSIIAIGDLTEVTLTDNSPFPNDFDDFLIEYAVIRLSVGNEFDVSQETTIMSSILQQIQDSLMGDDQPINQITGYFNSLPYCNKRRY